MEIESPGYQMWKHSDFVAARFLSTWNWIILTFCSECLEMYFFKKYKKIFYLKSELKRFKRLLFNWTLKKKERWKMKPEQIEASDASAVLVSSVRRRDAFCVERNDAQDLVVVPQRTSDIAPDSKDKIQIFIFNHFLYFFIS